MAFPSKPQPFSPPVRAATVWMVPKGAHEDLAAFLYADVMWGGEPHHSQVSDAQMAEWVKAAPQWVAGVDKFLGLLEKVGHIVREE